MKQVLLFALILGTLFGCKKGKPDDENSTNSSTTKMISDNQVLVAAHRGDWRNAPENSIPAIANCIEMGVDIVEVDVRLTRDSVPVLMHDRTIDRTTTGKGLVSDWTLDSLRSMYLRNGANHATRCRIPTLEEALQLAKGNVLLNLDKSYDIIPTILPVLGKTGMTQNVILKGEVSTEKLDQDYPGLTDSLKFMPIFRVTSLKDTSALVSLADPKLYGVEIIFSDSLAVPATGFDGYVHKGAKIWINSLWASLNGGYDDDRALQNPEMIYGFHVGIGADIIQTDRPGLLLRYLNQKNLHK